MAEDSIRVIAGRPTTGGDRSAKPHAARRRAAAPRVLSELLVLAALVVALLIAAAVADNFDAPVAWGFVSLLGAAYIVSRGLARRSGRDDVL
jgi:hypothetical protein